MTSLAFGFLMEHALPYFHGKRLFGVVVPGEIRYGGRGAELIRRYELQLLPWTIISLVAASFLPLSWTVTWSIVVTGIATIRAYAYAYVAGFVHGLYTVAPVAALGKPGLLHRH